ncbi:MAG: acylneuraminate cytidylyltransferase family protein [Flavobacteriaceae bacterium]|nr:acylneuraminate cytidylyltransferase family protein [Flavobacteriaceae bacterium]
MRNIVIIPARGGSKRFLNKNIQLLRQVPLIEYSIQYAKENCLYAKIVVSTDSELIKEIALQNGVEVVDRPLELSGDLCTTISTLQHVLENSNETFEYVTLLQPTNPLRPKKLFKEAFKILVEGNYDSLMTVTRNEQKFGKIIDGKFIPYNYEIGQRSQDLDPLFYENGLLYITKSSLILEGKIVGSANYPLVINHPFAKVDIDTIEDLEYAEYLLNNYRNTIL